MDEENFSRLADGAIHGMWAFEVAQNLMAALVARGVLTNEEADAMFADARERAVERLKIDAASFPQDESTPG